MTAKLTAVIAAILAAGCGRSEPPVEEKSANLAPVLPANPAPKLKPPDVPLWEAARVGNIEAVRLHLDGGMDANAKDEGGWVPLHGASGSGHREIVELLMANGAKVNVPAMSGKTALDYASRAAHKETADFLRRHGGKTRAELKAEEK
jgi:ankyrin repeat protein